MKRQLVYTGGYTEAKQMGSGEIVPAACPGIIGFFWDESTGTLTECSVAKEAVNPSWVEPDPSGEYLYSVSELDSFAGIGGSTVSAWKVNRESGELTLLNTQATGGEDACHLMLSPNGKYLLCANYSGGSVSIFPVREDHSLGTMSFLIRHFGKGPDAERQAGPHVHQVLLSPDGKHVYLSDLGLDALVCYDADWERGTLQKGSWPDIGCIPGQGARHALFNAAGDRLYQMTEMACEVNVYRYDPKTGEAERIQTISAMDEGISPAGSLGAAIHLHPGGRFLYVSVRGTNSDQDRLAVFAVDEKGCLKKIQSIFAGGKIPRDFFLTGDGSRLLCGASDSDLITVFSVDPLRGTLTPSGSTAKAGGVTRVAFMAAD